MTHLWWHADRTPEIDPLATTRRPSRPTARASWPPPTSSSRGTAARSGSSAEEPPGPVPTTPTRRPSTAIGRPMTADRTARPRRPARRGRRPARRRPGRLRGDRRPSRRPVDRPARAADRAAGDRRRHSTTLVADADASTASRSASPGSSWPPATRRVLCAIDARVVSAPVRRRHVRVVGEVPADVLAALDSTRTSRPSPRRRGARSTITGTFGPSGADGQPTIDLETIEPSTRRSRAARSVGCGGGPRCSGGRSR